MSSPSSAKLNKGEQRGSSSPDNSTSSHASPPMMVEHPKENQMACCSSKADDRSTLDRLLQGYTKFMGPGINQDRGLKLMQYTIWMFSYYVSHRLKSGGGGGNAAALVIIRDALKKLYNEMSFARYVIRLLALPPAMEAAYNGSWSVSATNYKGLHKFLGRLLAWSMIGYYPLEAGAYIQWQTPKLFFPQNNNKTGGEGGLGPPFRLAEKLSAWSCRFWLVYTLTEIVQCWLKLREEKQKLKSIEQRKKDDDYKENDDEKEEELMVVVPPKTDESLAKSNNVLRNLRLQILRDVLFTLPAIHWSLPNWDTQPWLSDPVVNTLMWLESVVCMYQSVVNFNESE